MACTTIAQFVSCILNDVFLIEISFLGVGGGEVKSGCKPCSLLIFQNNAFCIGMVEFLYKLSHASYFKWNTFLSYTLDQDSNYELPISLAIWWSFVLSFVLFNFFHTTFLEITCPGECYKRKVLLQRFLAEESETTSLDVKEWGLLIHMRQMVVVLVSTVWGDFISRGGKPCKLGKSREAAIPNFSFSVLSKRRWLVLNDHMATERRKGQKLTSWVTFKTMSCCQNPCLR